MTRNYNLCVEMVVSNEYNSKEYKEYIAKNYSLEKQITSIENVIKGIKKR
ncbi:hypothetical protein [Clostridium estertheticum]|nr:hypothetical protein [Clostridium estertheticum]MBU3076079.1 hypothetical protein [Clostridium estertheticum]MBU3166197.1 hypothetical protein [Clostridium estertheticum]MBZ9616501.1 hypothetical protein [Clostridium estertheticum subsp. laramiense]WAG72228.1 hypothetical protein LL032_13725 [Clostridium estertheticum]